EDIAKAMTLLVQQRIFNALLSGMEMNQLKFPFRVLFTLQKNQLQQQKLAMVGRPSTQSTAPHINIAPTGTSNPDLEHADHFDQMNPPADSTPEVNTSDTAPLINNPVQRDEATATGESKTFSNDRNGFAPSSDAQEIAHKTPAISHLAHLSMPHEDGSILNARCLPLA